MTHSEYPWKGVPFTDCLWEEEKLKDIFLCPRNYKFKTIATTGSSFTIWF